MTSPKKKSKNLTDMRAVKCNLNESQIINKENRSDDEIVANSQGSSESKLKKKIMDNALRKSGTLSLSQRDVFNNSSKNTFVKERSIKANDLINESIKMTRDWSGVRINTALSSNISKYSQSVSNNIINSKVIEKSEEKQIKDPLYFTKKDDESNQIMKKDKEKITITNKLNLKNFLSVDNSFDNKQNIEPKSVSSPLSEACIKKLQSLEIKLQHKVPLQHKIERHAGSRALSKQELQAFEKFAVLKKGVFDKEENNIIKKNWKSFCEIHNWKKNNVKPFLCFSYNGKCYLNFEQRKNFVRFLANGLPSRTLNSVYFRFRSLFDANVNTGKFTHKEDSIIVRHLSNTSSAKLINSSAHVAKILNRKRYSIRRRFRILIKKYNLKNNVYNAHESSSGDYKNSNNKNKDKNVKRTKNTLKNSICENVGINISWTYAMVQEFINTLTETSTCKLEELKNIVIDQTIWHEMGKKLNIDQKILQNFWYFQLHMQIFCPEPIYLNELKINLIEYIHRQDDKILENLAWDNVCLKFDGVPSLFLSKLFKHLIEYAKTIINSSTLKDIIQYLYNEHIPIMKGKSFDTFLPKLHFKNNKLIYVDKGKENLFVNKTKANVFSDEHT